ncbi:MAG: sigma 54-interacting transcriptional regulator, partial [Polyangiaceae bacterium]
ARARELVHALGDSPAPERAAQLQADGRRVLAALLALAEARAELATRGAALLEGYELAATLGDGDGARRLHATLSEAARELVRRVPTELRDAVRALPWVARGVSAPGASLLPEQARDLEQLVHALGERSGLRQLLERVVDALVLWTGVERGLLLLRAPDDRLVPRAARNLLRSDLSETQLSLSQTLAHRAMNERQPVVAVDAAGELSDVHRSVQVLKLRSVLAVPLIARDEVLGVVYLDDRIRRGAFGPRELSWARSIAALAAVAIADARDQVLLRRAARRAAGRRPSLPRRWPTGGGARRAERELARTRAGRETRFSYDEIVGESEPIRALLGVVDRVTSSEVPVLVVGESGSGKELVARAIHNNGPRAARPFVGENCGAIPEGLLESTLFGHARGAFTGAVAPRSGLFEAADKGTLFLDEIGEMSLGMQAKLLRVLEDGMVRPLGSERSRKVDVRVVAATHRDLEKMVAARTFREDLFYRLNIITLRIPPLRERSEDIPLIVSHLLAKHGGSKTRVTAEAMARLSGYAWPGNVRQLENEVRRALVLSDGTIDRSHLSPEVADAPAAAPRDLGLHVRQRVDALEVQLVREALSRTAGNQTQAAKILGLSRFGLQKMMKRLSI